MKAFIITKQKFSALEDNVYTSKVPTQCNLQSEGFSIADELISKRPPGLGMDSGQNMELRGLYFINGKEGDTVTLE